MSTPQPRSPGPASPAHAPTAWVYADDGRVVHRVAVGAVARVGSAPECHVCLSGRGLQGLHAEIRRDEAGYRLVPRVTSPLWIGDRPVTGAAELTHGDRVRLGDTSLLFVLPPEDNRTHHKTYVVIRRPDGFVFHWAAQAGRFEVGRTHGDLLVMDDAIPGRHFAIESWGPDAIYLVNERESAPVGLYGEAVASGCRRVYNGGVVTAGRSQLAVYGRPREAVVQPPWLAAPDTRGTTASATTVPPSAAGGPSVHDLSTRIVGPKGGGGAPVPEDAPATDDAETRETAIADIVAAETARGFDSDAATSQVSQAAIEQAARAAARPPTARMPARTSDDGRDRP